MDEASFALKLPVPDNAGLVAVEAADIAAGMGIAFTCIGVPRVRLHSMRQWQGAWLELGTHAATVANSKTYMKGDRRRSGRKTLVRAGCGKGCRVQPGKISRFNFDDASVAADSWHPVPVAGGVIVPAGSRGIGGRAGFPEPRVRDRPDGMR